jgi:bifunctional enzyme CysN/CysC
MNEVGICNISTRSPIAFDTAENRTTGAFILIDRINNATDAGDPAFAAPPKTSIGNHWTSASMFAPI